jgi:hypothetical protein
MKPQGLQLGTYQIQNAYIEMHNGKQVPMATAIFMGLGWSKFDFQPRTIRLQGLYNSSSIGPKESYPKDNIQSLNLYMVQIMDLVARPNPLNELKMQYLVRWDAYKPSNYDELIQEEMEIFGDILINDDIEAANLEELNSIAMDFLIMDQQHDSEVEEPEVDEENSEDDEEFKIY